MNTLLMGMDTPTTIGLVLAVLLVLWLMWRSLRRRTAAPVPRVTIGRPRKVGNAVIYGIPGAGLAAGDKFDDNAVNTGIRGEQRTAELLEGALSGLDHPVAILHSVRYPGSRNADVDHLVISGRNAWAIDSKCWAKGTWSMVSSNSLRHDITGGGSEFREVHMDDALRNFRREVPRGRWQKAYVVVHPYYERTRDFKVNRGERGGVVLADAATAVAELTDAINRSGGPVDQHLLAEAVRRLK